METETTETRMTHKGIDEYAESIILSLTRAEKYLKVAMAGYISAGEKLKQAKESLGHGEWAPLIERIGISRMTANRYIRLAEDIRIVKMARRNMMLHLTQNELLKMTKLDDQQFHEVVESEDPSEKLRELTASEPATPTPLAEVKKELKQTQHALQKANERIATLEDEIAMLRGRANAA